MSGLQKIVFGGGVVVALLLAVALVVQIPTASSLTGRQASASALRRRLVNLSAQTATVTVARSSAQSDLTAAVTRAGRLARQAKRQRGTIADLQKQVASLQRDVQALGG